MIIKILVTCLLKHIIKHMIMSIKYMRGHLCLLWVYNMIMHMTMMRSIMYIMLITMIGIMPTTQIIMHIIVFYCC